MRVLLTGASGFVGRRLARALAGAGHRVAGTYIRERPELPELDLHEADLRDRAALAAVVSRCRPEVVVHLAGLSHVGESWRRIPDSFQINVLGTENLLRAAPGIRTVFASSAEVYGVVPEDEQPIPEARPAAPLTPYGLSKAAAEQLALRDGAVIVRAFNVVGPGQSPEFALPSFARRLAAIRAGRQPATLRVGNLEARRDFVHVDDAVEAYLVLVGSGREGEIFNLGSGRARSLREALDLTIAASGLEVRVETDPELLRPADVPLLAADSRRLQALGWRPRRSLEQAVGDLWAETAAAS